MNHDKPTHKRITTITAIACLAGTASLLSQEPPGSALLEQLTRVLSQPRLGHPQLGRPYATEEDLALARRAALLMLESHESTIQWLGTPLQEFLRESLHEELTRDLLVAAWADLQCAAGEGDIKAAALDRAGRFKELALPVLWDLANNPPPLPKSMVQDNDRIPRYCRDIIVHTVERRGDRRGILEALEAADETELARFVDHDTRPDESSQAD